MHDEKFTKKRWYESLSTSTMIATLEYLHIRIDAPNRFSDVIVRVITLRDPLPVTGAAQLDCHRLTDHSSLDLLVSIHIDL